MLIVDDSEFVREALGDALRQNGDFEVVAAKNGKEALDLLAGECEVKAIVLDVGMPILDGPQMLEQLARTQGPIPFVVAIGHQSERATLEQCLGLGAREILTKPLDLPSLRRILSKAVPGLDEEGQCQP